MDLILAEKSSAAKAISRALGEVTVKRYNKLPYYVIGDQVYVSYASGHLYNLYPRITERGTYPKWEYDWVSCWQLQPNSKYAQYGKKCFETLKYLIAENNFDRYIIGTDYDIEGTVIGFMIFVVLKIPFEKVFRMKMNSLARDEVKRAYNELSPPDYEWFSAGLTRHEMDILWGINLTEAFSKALSKYRRRWRTVSLGRVQTPTLKFVVDREKAIRTFKPQPYWNVRLLFTINNVQYDAYHQLGDIWELTQANTIINRCTMLKDAVVTDKKVDIKEIAPPFSFSLPTLQQEAYYKLKFQPDFTDRKCQSLYEQALISYPRTGSTSIMFVPTKAILESMRGTVYDEYINEIVNKGYTPRKGGFYDGAHSAIFPTAEKREPTNEYEIKLLELIKRRFLATFYPSVKRETTKIIIKLGEDSFVMDGIKTLEEGWLKPYLYVKMEDRLVPVLNIGDKINVDKLELVEKITKPPYRYSMASLIKEMERNSIGTKATRSQITRLLWSRGYIISERGKGIVPKLLGEKLIGVAEKFAPSIIDVKLTRELELDLESIEKGNITRQQVLSKTKDTITKILGEITQNIDSIGKELVSD